MYHKQTLNLTWLSTTNFGIESRFKRQDPFFMILTLDRFRLQYWAGQILSFVYKRIDTSNVINRKFSLMSHATFNVPLYIRDHPRTNLRNQVIRFLGNLKPCSHIHQTFIKTFSFNI